MHTTMTMNLSYRYKILHFDWTDSYCVQSIWWLVKMKQQKLLLEKIITLPALFRWSLLLYLVPLLSQTIFAQGHRNVNRMENC